MICANCGFQNQPGDEFCGSCGQFLEWTGASEGDGAMAPPGGASSTADAATTAVPTPAQPAVVAPAPGASGPFSGPLPPGPGPGVVPVGSSGASWPAGLVRCNVCGTANELTRTFCMNCGAKLPKAGTTGGLAVAAAASGGRAGGRAGSGRAVLYAIGGILIFLVAAGIAFVAMGGLGPARPATPGPSLVAGLPSASVAASGVTPPTASSPVGASPTDQPAVTTSPSGAPESAPPASEPPATPPPASGPPPTQPPVGGFICGASDFTAAAPGNWTITSATWSRRGQADSLSLAMTPSSSASLAEVKADLLPPDQVQPTYGFAGPASGDVALVLSFTDPVKLGGPFGSSVGFRALQEFQVLRHGGLVYAVLGINGAGCYSLSSDAWANGVTGPAEFVVQIQR